MIASLKSSESKTYLNWSQKRLHEDIILEVKKPYGTLKSVDKGISNDGRRLCAWTSDYHVRGY